MMLMLNVRMLVGCGVVRPPGCRTRAVFQGLDVGGDYFSESLTTSTLTCSTCPPCCEAEETRSACPRGHSRSPSAALDARQGCCIVL